MGSSRVFVLSAEGYALSLWTPDYVLTDYAWVELLIPPPFICLYYIIYV